MDRLTEDYTVLRMHEHINAAEESHCYVQLIHSVTTALIYSKGLRVGTLTVGECVKEHLCDEHTQSTSSLRNLLYTHT